MWNDFCDNSVLPFCKDSTGNKMKFLSINIALFLLLSLSFSNAKAQSGASGDEGTYLNYDNYVNSNRTAGGDFEIDLKGNLEIGVTGEMEIMGSVSNNGIIEIDSNGVLSIYGDMYNAGTIILHKGSTLHFYGNKWQNTTTARVIDGAPVNTIPGGDLNFNGDRPAVPADWLTMSPFLAAYSAGNATQFSDGADIPMDVVLHLQNKNGVELINSPTRIEGKLQWDIPNGNIILANNDLTFNRNASQDGYGPDRYAITSGTGHLTKEHFIGEWVFPVGKDTNDYTPAAVNNVTTNTMHVAVQDYETSASVESTEETISDGMQRTWNIYADIATGISTFNLQHNSSTNQADFAEPSSYVTRWNDAAPNNTGDHSSFTAWQANIATGGAAGDISSFGIVAGSNMNNRTYRNFAVSSSDPIAFYTKASDAFKARASAQILVFDADSVACQEASVSFTTGIENKINKFQLQHSLDGVTFSTITTFEPKGSNSTYSFEHLTAVEGTNYYRIVMLDETGDYTISSVVSTIVSCSEDDIVVILYPNPSTDFIKIAGLTGNSEIHILNMHGRMMHSVKTTNNIETIDIRMLPAATYVARILTGEKHRIINIKFVKF